MLLWGLCHVLSTAPVSAEHMHSSRETPYNQELRRHQRAPDALAAALAKRAFVRKTPYLVTTASLPRPEGQLATSCGPRFLPMSDIVCIRQDSAALPRAAVPQQAFAAASGQGSDMPASAAALELACSGQDTVMPSLALPPQQEAGCSANATSPKQSSRLREKRLSGRLTSYQRGVTTSNTEIMQHAQSGRAPAALAQKYRAGNRAGKPAADEESLESSKQSEASAASDRLPFIRSQDVSWPSTHFLGACTAGIACLGAKEEQPAAAQQPVQSLAERYIDMKRTVMERLTCGAS